MDQSQKHLGRYTYNHYTTLFHAYVYSFRKDSVGKQKFEVKAWCLNPYTDKKIHFIICPSHQVNV